MLSQKNEIRFFTVMEEACLRILQGLLIALDNIDEVIKIIRGSAHRCKGGTEERFGLSAMHRRRQSGHETA